MGLSLQVACDDWMELIPPEGLIREEFWKSKEDVESVVMGAYETFSRQAGRMFLYGELRGDMITGGSSQGGSERNIQEGNIYSDNYLCNWSEFYKVINYCNEVIANAADVQDLDNTFTDYQLQAYLSEAIFIRSLAYFYLVRVFKDVPYITNPSESDDTDFYPEKTDGDEILGYLIDDLEEYRTYATTDGYKTVEELKGRATKASFDALLADINLWMFNYDAVIDHVSKIQANTEFKLNEYNEWFSLFNPGNQAESIFEFQFDTERSQSNNLFGMFLEDNKNTYASTAAIDLLGLEESGELWRGEGASIVYFGNETQYLIWKYIGSEYGKTSSVRSQSEEGSANFIIYRLPDVLLMKAEALSQLERYQEAEDLVNFVRGRAQVAPLNIADSPVAFEDAILDERARELAFEGKRWFDLMRMGRRNNFKRKNKLIEIILSNVPSTQKRILEVKLSNPLGWYLPIHEDEIERNKNLDQNPYYDI